MAGMLWLLWALKVGQVARRSRGVVSMLGLALATWKRSLGSLGFSGGRGPVGVTSTRWCNAATPLCLKRAHCLAACKRLLVVAR
eukprot:4130898-Lingulodinium_polyedra.AAC.1